MRETRHNMALIDFPDLSVADICRSRFREKTSTATTQYSRGGQLRHQKAKLAYNVMKKDDDSLAYWKLTVAIKPLDATAMLSEDIEHRSCNVEVATIPTVATTIGLDYADAKTSAFVRALYRLCRAEATEDDAIDLVYNRLSAMLAEQEVDACDDILESIDEKKITPAVIASVLTITAGAKRVLSERRGFYERARDYLNGIRGATATERLLVGLA